MKKIFNLLLLFIFMSTVVLAQENALEDIIPSDPQFKTGTLPNGLRYYIRYNKKPENKVELRLAVNAGSVLEDDDQQGLAHFMEHMNFNGLKNFPENELVQYLRSIGVEFGNDLNAYTSFDETIYILPVPSDQPGKLDSAFMILADWSGGALLTSQDIDEERGVILAESRLGKGADDRMMKKWFPALFNGSKYGQRLPIGIDSILEKFDYSKIRQFHNDWYRPSLEAVIVVGDMPVEKAEKMIVEKFGSFKDPAQPRHRPAYFDVQPYKESKAMVVSDPEADATFISILGISHTRKPITTKSDYYYSIKEDLCNAMLNTRFNELRAGANPPFIFGYGYTGGFVRGYDNFSLMASSGGDQIKNATVALIKETMRVKKYGYTQAELDRAKASMLASYEKKYNERDKMESEALVNQPVSNFLIGDAMPGIEWEYNFVKDNIGNITLDQLKDVIKKMDIDEKYFAYITSQPQPGLPDDKTFKSWIDSALLIPVEPYTEKALANSLLEKAPVAGKIVKTEKNEKLGTITYTLSNNAVVCIKPTDFKNDEVLLEASRLGGYSVYTGKDYQSAQYSNNVVETMGYGSFSSTDLRKFLAGKVVTVNPVIEDYSEKIQANSSIKDMETMFMLIYLKCTSPRFDQDAFNSWITRSKQQIATMKDNPMYLFMDTTYNTLYKGHPLAHMIFNKSDYDNVNPENAVKFYNERLGIGSGMYFTIVGSFTEEQIKPLIENYIASLPAGDINTNYKDLGLIPLDGKQSFTLHKGSEPQAMLMHYFTGQMPYNVDDNFMLGQLNEIINNKVIDDIREKMGAIYGGGVGGNLEKYPKGEFVIQSYFPCSPDNINAIDAAFMEMIQNVQKDGGITDDDVKKVREPALEHNKVSLKENKYWLSYLQRSHLYGNDPERILTREQMLKDLTKEKLIETARKFYTTPNVFTSKWLPESVR